MKRVVTMLLSALVVLAPLVAVAATASAAAPDLRVTPSPDQISQVDSGGNGTLEFTVSGAASDARLTATVAAPAKLQAVVHIVGPAGRPYTTCTTTGVTTVCDLGALSGAALTLGVEFDVPTTAAISSHIRVSADVEPVPGPDANPADNTDSVNFPIFASPDVSEHFTPQSPTTLARGTTVMFHDSFTNHSASASIVGFGPFTAASVQIEPAGIQDQETAIATWTIGTLAVGATASLNVPISALAVSGTGELAWFFSSDGAPHSGDVDQPLIPLTVTTAAPSTPTPTAPTPGPLLADTGATPTPLLLLGLILVLSGLGCLQAGRRRTRSAPSH